MDRSVPHSIPVSRFTLPSSSSVQTVNSGLWRDTVCGAGTSGGGETFCVFNKLLVA